jgi:hypothetical protein
MRRPSKEIVATGVLYMLGNRRPMTYEQLRKKYSDRPERRRFVGSALHLLALHGLVEFAGSPSHLARLSKQSIRWLKAVAASKSMLDKSVTKIKMDPPAKYKLTKLGRALFRFM